jgi:roadblock/LC7 domain-containing protein
MKAMNSEVAKVVEGAKKAQAKLHTALKKQDWIEEARKYAEGQRKEVKKLISGDMAKVKTFLEKERKEFEKLLKNLRKAGKKQAAGAKKKSSGVRKKASA